MTDSQLRVVRAAPGLVWRALDGDDVVGAVSAMLLPNDRWFVSFGPCRADARQPLLDAVAENTGSDLYITADDADHEWLRDLAELGFAELRRESNIVIPTDPAVTGLELTAEPDGTVIISAADAFEDDLRLLDDALRRDVPGAEGWHWDPADFHDETFCSEFDPRTYLVAVDERSGRYIGLARVWITSGRPRLGLIAVLPPYRRRRLASVLLARAFGELHKRGATEVTAEVDDANIASRSLLFGAGARRTSGTVELVLRR
jgi:GNAT superfamily N-acetyltransferase